MANTEATVDGISHKEKEVIVVSKSDLPLSCPMPGKNLWAMHPRVFLPIEREGKVVCPYCGAQYVLQD